MFKVKVPPIAGVDADPVEVAKMSPNEAPTGVPTLLAVPANVKVVVVTPSVNVAKVAPPLALKAPVVVKVTGSAFAMLWLNAMIATTAMLKAIVLEIERIEVPIVFSPVLNRFLRTSTEVQMITLQNPLALGLVWAVL
jgi:hypothetical protein